MTPAIKSVELSTVTLPYVEQGDPSGVPVLFVHGYANSSPAPLRPCCRPFRGPFMPSLCRSAAMAMRAPRPRGINRDFSADLAAFMDALAAAIAASRLAELGQLMP